MYIYLGTAEVLRKQFPRRRRFITEKKYKRKVCMYLLSTKSYLDYFVYIYQCIMTFLILKTIRRLLQVRLIS